MAGTSYSQSFPAIRGVQSGRPFYIAMCPMRIIPKLFRFDEDDVPPELRAQRTLNRSRIPEISSYLIDNSNDYTLSSLTASVNTNVLFDPFSDVGVGQNMGTLSIPMDAQILINDGQHRRAAIEEAIKENPELGFHDISVLFFIDEGLTRSQQMFADLNKHAIRPSDSISTLYDLRDTISELARHIQKHVRVFSRLTELEKSSLSNRSTKLFTLSSIKNASKALLKKGTKDVITKAEKDLAVEYWNEVAANMPEWQQAFNKEVSTKELRENSIHAHAVLLLALGHVGADLLSKSKWKPTLKKLKGIDWARNNKDWDGRAMVHGRISKTRTNVQLTANYTKKALGITLNAAEEAIEKDYQK